MLGILCAIVLVASLLLGGGTRSGFLADATVQLLAIPLLLIAAWRLRSQARRPGISAGVALASCMTMVPLLQLVPLPYAIWSALPGAEVRLDALAVTGGGQPWMPLSTTPEATWLGALSLLPPLALFLGVIQLDYRERRWLTLAVIGIGIASVFLGLAQVAQGPNSALRPFAVTNPTEAVGLFANRNHYAALLYSVLLLTAAWISAPDDVAAMGASRLGGGRDSAGLLLAIVGFTIIVALLAAQAMARSRAGLALSFVAIVGAFAVAFVGRQRTSSAVTARLLVAATGLAAVLVVQFALYRVMERFSGASLENMRLAFARNTIEAARAYMPFGSGVGSFVPVYGRFEQPADIHPSFANRAHNDILELSLETGIIGLALMSCFLVWLGARALTTWRQPPEWAAPLDTNLARAASLVVVLLVVHSVLDYPLRTGAMMAVLALSCAMLVPTRPAAAYVAPPAVAAAPAKRGTKPTRRKSRRPMPAPSPVPPGAGAEPAWAKADWSAVVTEPRPTPAAAPRRQEPPRTAVEPGQRWGEDVEWPEAWRKKP